MNDRKPRHNVDHALWDKIADEINASAEYRNRINKYHPTYLYSLWMGKQVNEHLRRQIFKALEKIK